MAVDAARAKSLFLAASDLADPAERAVYLERECGGDAELRARVEALLRASDAAPLPAAGGATVDSAPGEAETEDYGDPTGRVGAILAGKYKLVEEIGEGGMGSVFMAQQTEPVKRAVAVKVVKAGMDSKAVLARFEAERQALAMMDHPNIARVLDAGTTDGGRPFFVMELVKGTPITKFCDERRLTPRQRLELFVPVCQAIQHAHQKGIIHRDIKPSNVLVAMYDDLPVPKVIDFGVAKAAGQALTDKTLLTGFGALVGTPEYMSPEQASLNNLDIDTRSDVYSLGVLLYELLTGTTPVDKKSLGKAALLEILRIVREVDAPRPSAKLSTIDTLPSVAANRGTEPARLSRLMKGELDWLVMRALEKDRTRRYETANALARDIQRYLADEPVEACPPSTAYKLRKFGQKHKTALTVAAGFGAVLALGVVVSAWQAVRATLAEHEARSERDRALIAELKAEAVNDFLQNDLLAQASPDKQVGPGVQSNPDITVRTVLDRANKTIASKFVGQPLVEASIRLTIGNAYRGLGMYTNAEKHLEIASDLRRRELGEEHLDTLTALECLARVYVDRDKCPQAEKICRKTLEVRQRVLGEDHPATLESTYDLSWVYWLEGKLSETEPLTTKVLKERRRLLGDDHPDTLEALSDLGFLYLDQNRYEEAELPVTRALEGFRSVRGEEHSDTLKAMVNLGLLYQLRGQYERAKPLFVKALEINRRVRKGDHPDTILALGKLADLYRDQGQYAQAEPLAVEAFEASRRVQGEKHRSTLERMQGLADLYLAEDKFALAEPLYTKLLDIQRPNLGDEHTQVTITLGQLGLNLLLQKKYAEAAPLLRDCLAGRQKQILDSWLTFNTQSLLGGALLGQRKYAEAEPLLVKGYEGLKTREQTIPKSGGGELRIPEALDRLIELYTALNKPDVAKKWQAERAKYPQGNPKTLEKR
jgi:serine/threonine protein kinase/tetratricopeptide (TPR) repeat protein